MVVVGASDFQTCQMLYNLSRREGGGEGRCRGRGKGLTDGGGQIDKEKQGPALSRFYFTSFQIGLGATSDPGNYPLPACLE